MFYDVRFYHFHEIFLSQFFKKFAVEYTVETPLESLTGCRSFCFADGVGNVQQSGLRSSHVPQHERLGFGVEAGNIFSLQLLAQVSALDRPHRISRGVNYMLKGSQLIRMNPLTR